VRASYGSPFAVGPGRHVGGYYAEAALNEQSQMLGVVRTCAIRAASKIGKTDNKRITVVHQLDRPLRNSFILNWLPRMDSKHDKLIQSHLVHDGCAIVATFSGFRAASLRVCPTGSVYLYCLFWTFPCGRGVENTHPFHVRVIIPELAWADTAKSGQDRRG